MFALLVLLNSLLHSFPIVLQPHHPMHALVEFDYCIKAGHHWYHNFCSPCAITAKMQMLQRETSAGYDACHPFVLGVCIPLEPGALSLLSGDCTTGRNSFISMNFTRFACSGPGAAGASWWITPHALFTASYEVCLLIPPLLVSAKVFGSFCPLGCCWHLWNVGQL